MEIRAHPIYVATLKNAVHTLGTCISMLRVHWTAYIYALDRNIQVIPAHDIRAPQGAVVTNSHLSQPRSNQDNVNRSEPKFQP